MFLWTVPKPFPEKFFVVSCGRKTDFFCYGTDLVVGFQQRDLRHFAPGKAEKFLETDANISMDQMGEIKTAEMLPL